MERPIFKLKSFNRTSEENSEKYIRKYPFTGKKSREKKEGNKNIPDHQKRVNSLILQMQGFVKEIIESRKH